MDVGDPSNMKRILDIYKNAETLKEEFSSWSFTDSETKECILHTLQNYSYLLDPHSSVGLLGLRKFLELNEEFEGLFLGTAHPAKFADIIEPIIKETVKMPESLKSVIDKEKKSIALNNDYDEFSDYLLTKFK